jgi:hypothetical protein
VPLQEHTLLLWVRCLAGLLWQVDTNAMSDADTDTLVKLLPLGEEDYYSLIDEEERRQQCTRLLLPSGGEVAPRPHYSTVDVG